MTLSVDLGMELSDELGSQIGMHEIALERIDNLPLEQRGGSPCGSCNCRDGARRCNIDSPCHPRREVLRSRHTECVLSADARDGG
jgi:hypothetical protein